MTMKKRAETTAFMEDPANVNELLEAVACGCSMLEWSSKNNLSYGNVCRYMMAEENKKRLDEARDIRKEYLADLVIRNLRMFSDIKITDAYDDDGNLLPLSLMPEKMQRAISSVQVNRTTIGEGSTASVDETTKITTVSQTKALEMLGKYGSMFVERQEVTGKDGADLPVVFLPRNGRDEEPEE